MIGEAISTQPEGRDATIMIDALMHVYHETDELVTTNILVGLRCTGGRG